MGREAVCPCLWNAAEHKVKVLLEPPNLILRGELRRSIPFSDIEGVTSDGDCLCFTVAGESFALFLGHITVEKWAKALLKPPPTLAKKLGITPKTIVRMIGPWRMRL